MEARYKRWKQAIASISDIGIDYPVSIHRFFSFCAQLSLTLSNSASAWQGNNKRTWDKRGRAGENSNTPGQAKCRLSLTLSQKRQNFSLT
jgi:hypothetical protein